MHIIQEIMATDIVQIKLEIKIPDSKWLSMINRKFFNLQISILSKYLIGENFGITLFEIRGRGLDVFIKELKGILIPDSFHILFEAEDLLILNVRTRDPWILAALVKNELLLRYPLTIKEGIIMIETITPRDKLDTFLNDLEKNKIDFKIISIGHYQSSALISEKQRNILRTIYDEGYYEVPRKRSLTSLSRLFNISPSALSESIRRIHKRLVKIILQL